MLVVAVGYGSDPYTFTCVSHDNIDWNTLEDVLEFLSKEHNIQAYTTDEILVFNNEHLEKHWTYEDGLGQEIDDTLDGD